MSFVQRLILRFVSSERAAEMKAHSQDWTVRCHCGKETTIWDMGGIRYKAIGNSRNLLKCQKCGKRTWHLLYKKSAGLPK